MGNRKQQRSGSATARPCFPGGDLSGVWNNSFSLRFASFHEVEFYLSGKTNNLTKQGGTSNPSGIFWRKPGTMKTKLKILVSLAFISYLFYLS